MTDIVEKSSSHVLGIDLGTTNCAAGIYRKGKTEIININGTKTMPSAMSVLKDGEILVGSQAKSRSLIAPESTVLSIKRHMGADWTKEFEEIPGKVFTPVEVSAEILLKLIDSILQNETVDLDGTPKYAVICVPANFNDAQKKATKMAAELANLETLTLLEEPIAAAYAYAIEKERVQTVLVYDLGGGTFDVSILEVDSTGDAKKQFKVLAKEGIQKLGGDDFDQRIMERVAGEFAKASNIDILDQEKDQGINSKKIREAQQKLLEAVIAAKHELSEATKTTIDIPNLIQDETGQPHHIDNFEITREQFNEEIRSLILQTKDAVEKALSSAKLEIEDIDRIILVGGSCKIPLVKEMLHEMFGKEPYSDTDPDTAIARGAAILGATMLLPDPELERPKEDTPEFVIDIDNIVTHNLGIEVVGGKFSCLISKGTEIPSGDNLSLPHNEKTEEVTKALQAFITEPLQQVSLKIEGLEAGLENRDDRINGLEKRVKELEAKLDEIFSHLKQIDLQRYPVKADKEKVLKEPVLDIQDLIAQSKAEERKNLKEDEKSIELCLKNAEFWLERGKRLKIMIKEAADTADDVIASSNKILESQPNEIKKALESSQQGLNIIGRMLQRFIHQEDRLKRLDEDIELADNLKELSEDEWNRLLECEKNETSAQKKMNKNLDIIRRSNYKLVSKASELADKRQKTWFDFVGKQVLPILDGIIDGKNHTSALIDELLEQYQESESTLREWFKTYVTLNSSILPMLNELGVYRMDIEPGMMIDFERHEPSSVGADPVMENEQIKEISRDGYDYVDPNGNRQTLRVARVVVVKNNK